MPAYGGPLACGVARHFVKPEWKEASVHPDLYIQFKGVFLLGPTGTGKTHLAQALPRSSSSPMRSSTGLAALARLAHTSHQVVIKGQSYRKKLAPEPDNA